jgi:hypothetical protein
MRNRRATRLSRLLLPARRDRRQQPLIAQKLVDRLQIRGQKLDLRRQQLVPQAGEGRMLNYPRQQNYRRLARAGIASTASAAAVLLALLAALGGLLQIAGLLLLAAVALGLRTRNWARLAGRASVGARSEDHVQRALAPLKAEGWRLRHSLPWQGRGDINSIAIAPTRFAFAIETKTRTYTPAHLARARDSAHWLKARRRRWCPNGALPVLCVVRDRGLERVEAGVLVGLGRPPSGGAANGGGHPTAPCVPLPRPARRCWVDPGALRTYVLTRLSGYDGISTQIEKPRGSAGCVLGIGFQGVSIRIELEHTFVSAYRYTVAEYDPQRPWLLVGEIRHLTVELDDEHSFTSWAARRWPASRFKAELDAGRLGPWQRSG